MKFNKTALFRVLAFLISTVLTVGAFLLCLKMFGVYLMSHRHPGVADEDADEPTMRTMEYYPFTGGQIQPISASAAVFPGRISTTISTWRAESTGFSSTFASKHRRRKRTTRYELC